MKIEFTDERREQIKAEMLKFRLPLISRLFKRSWKVLKYTFLPVFVILVTLFSIYNSIPYYSASGETIWTICKAIVLFYIFGIGGFAFVSHIFELRATRKLREKLGLTEDEFYYFVVIFQIKGY